MPRTVRVGDTVNYVLPTGNETTAEVTVVTTQDQVDIVFYNPQRRTFAAVARATTTPPAPGTFHEEA
jgi:hypothetical protein